MTSSPNIPSLAELLQIVPEPDDLPYTRPQNADLVKQYAEKILEYAKLLGYNPGATTIFTDSELVKANYLFGSYSGALVYLGFLPKDADQLGSHNLCRMYIKLALHRLNRDPDCVTPETIECHRKLVQYLGDEWHVEVLRAIERDSSIETEIIDTEHGRAALESLRQFLAQGTQFTERRNELIDAVRAVVRQEQCPLSLNKLVELCRVSSYTLRRFLGLTTEEVYRVVGLPTHQQWLLLVFRELECRLGRAITSRDFEYAIHGCKFIPTYSNFMQHLGGSVEHIRTLAYALPQEVLNKGHECFGYAQQYAGQLPYTK